MFRCCDRNFARQKQYFIVRMTATGKQQAAQDTTDYFHMRMLFLLLTSGELQFMQSRGSISHFVIVFIIWPHLYLITYFKWIWTTVLIQIWSPIIWGMVKHTHTQRERQAFCFCVFAHKLNVPFNSRRGRHSPTDVVFLMSAAPPWCTYHLPHAYTSVHTYTHTLIINGSWSPKQSHFFLQYIIQSFTLLITTVVH